MAEKTHASRRLTLVLLITATVALPAVLVVGLGFDVDRFLGWRERLHFALAALLPFGVAQVLRGLRYKLLEPGSHPLPSMISLASIQGALNQILPARAGELSYPVLMKKFQKTRLLSSTGVLVQARLLDLVSAGLWLGGSALAVPSVRASLAGRSLVAVTGGLALVGMVLLVAGPPLLKRMMSAWRRWRRKPEPDFNDEQSSLTRLRLLLALVISLGIWGGLFLTIHLFLLWCGEHVTFLQAAVASSGVVATSFLPVNTLLNLGIAEAGWVAGLALIGFDTAAGTALGFRLHAGIFGVNVFYGLIGFVYMVTRAGRKAK